MLSTENPPPDLPCSSEIPQLKSSNSDISSDERDSDKYNQHQVEVDPFKTGLDDNNPLPKFSIRDYVSKKRGKDIKTHWPFSPKNLQLCLKHGLKDLLPPFQTLESVRNPSTVNSAVKLSGSIDHLLSVSSNNVSENLESSRLEEDKECPSTTTSLSENLPGSSVEKPESAVPAANKVESNTQNPVKKCRLIVKLSNIAEPKSNEELSLNTSMLSETMASKVCPVCKTFSSSSNTTLNAHIDQCLSGESTIKWTANKKVIKHRIKPRKTRLMVDIYATSRCCTLEDLDRRNGTNWASNLGFPAQDLEVYAKEKNSEENDNEGAVYFDSNGTKLRILSTFNGIQSSSNAKDEFGPIELVKRDKGSKVLLSCKKKKYLVQRDKILKCPPYEQRSCSPRPDHCPKVNNGQEKNFHPEEDEKEDLAQPLEDCDKMKSNDFGMIKQWVGSKRTGLKKKINMVHEKQHPDKIIKNLRVKSNLPSLGHTIVKRTRDLSSPILSDDNNPLLSTEHHKRKENLSFNSHDEYMEQPCLRTRAGSPELQGKKNDLILSNCNVEKPRNDALAVHKRCMDPPNTGDHASSPSTKKIRSINPTINADSSLTSSRMSQAHIFSSGGKEFGSLNKTSSYHASLSGGKKLSSLTKNLLPVTHASVSESKKNLRRKHFDFKKRRLHSTSGSDEEALDQYAIQRRDNLVEEASGKSMVGRTRVLKIRKKKRAGFLNTGKEGDTTLKDSDASPESHNHRVEKNIDSSVGGNVLDGTSNVLDAVKEAKIRDEFVCDPTSKVSGREVFIGFNASLDSGFQALAGPSDVEMEMFSADKVGKDFVSSNTNVEVETNANEEGRGNYFVDVDPIPIPGPPGSFLPSPGRMGSEELQGNSSLTTCRIHPSEDEHELVDRDSSDSPVSAMSFVSNSIAARSEHRIDPVVESCIPFEQVAAGGDGKPNLDQSRPNLISPEMSPHRFQNSHPCCCTWKEGILQSDSVNYQESQLLKRCTMSSRPNDKLYSNNLRPETLPEKGYAPLLVSPSSDAKYPAYGDCESPTPSTPNPVLRLMGKNLMVVNKEENLPPQTRHTQSSMVNDHLGLLSSVDNAVSSENIQNDHCSFHRTLSRGPRIFDNMQSRIPELSPHPSRVMLSSKSFGGSFTSSFECHEYAVGCKFTPDQLGPKIRLEQPCGKHKEIIVIDDSPENEESLAIKATYRENTEAGGSSGSISTLKAVGYDSRHVNPPPFYSYQTRCYPLSSGSQMVQNSNIQMLPAKGMNENLVGWNRVPEGSSVLHPNSLTASSPSTAHLRSSLYFSHGFYSLPTNFT